MRLIDPLEANVEQTECKKLISAAFAHRPYPGDDKIAFADGRYPDYEGHGVAELFRGRDWRQVALIVLLQEYRGDPSATISFLTEEGFRYYLPAFLLMALEPDGGDIADALVFALTAPGSDKREGDRQFLARVGGLTTEERAAVICALHCLVERYEREGLPDNPAKAALQRYWEPAPGL